MSEGIYSFRDLAVWQKSFKLTKDIYTYTSQLPKSEQFGITSQIQRAAVSIPSNIAEGQQRHNSKEFNQFLGIAKGSAAELETQLLLASDIYGLDCVDLVKELHSVQKMLASLARTISSKTNH